MGFHVKWISHHLSPNPNLFASDRGGIRRLVDIKIHLTWKTMQNAYHLTCIANDSSGILRFVRKNIYGKPCKMHIAHYDGMYSQIHNKL